MPGHIYTREELMLDDSFINYCLSTGAAVPSEWRAIIRDNPDQEKTFEEAKKLVLALHGGLSRFEVKRQIDLVRKQLKERYYEAFEEKTEVIPALSSAFVLAGNGQIKRKFLRTFFSYGVPICLVVVVTWLVFFKQAGHSTANEMPQYATTYQSLLGQRQTVTLPDGTVVVLNSSSRLSINADFNNGKREIHLSGDAFFKVAKNVKKPFIVYTGNIATIALGTEFYVHGNKGSSKKLQVDLLEGKVKMADVMQPGSEIILLPGETGRSLQDSSLVKGVFDSLHLRNWISGRLSFHETPVLKAIEQVEVWYGIEIEVRKKGLSKRLVNGDFQDKPLQDVLKLICFAINGQHSFADNRIIIE